MIWELKSLLECWVLRLIKMQHLNLLPEATGPHQRASAPVLHDVILAYLRLLLITAAKVLYSTLTATQLTTRQD